MPDVDGHLLEGDVVKTDSTLPPEITEFNMIGLYDLETREMSSVPFVPQMAPVANWVSVRDRLVARGNPWILCYMTDTEWAGKGYETRSNTRGEYLTYDLKWSDSPVNQVPRLREWKPLVARFAHGFDITHGSRSFNALSEDTQDVVTKLVHGLAGSGWLRLQLWEAMDAATDPAWATFEAWVKVGMDAICDECDSETFARRLGNNINATAFKAKHDAGQIWSTDRSTRPWEPGRSLSTLTEGSVNEESRAQFHAANEVRYNAAIDFYDAEVSAALIPHSHDDE